MKRERHVNGRLTCAPTQQNLFAVAQSIFSAAERSAFDQGKRDFQSSTRDHPPYGFSNLKDAWRAGWLEASQEARQNCKHERLNPDGICYRCGGDRRGI